MLINVGHDNFVNSELISVVLKPDSSPAKRLRQAADYIQGITFDS